MAYRRRRAAGTRRTRRRQASNNHRRHQNHYSGGGGHSSTGGGGVVGLITGIVDLVQSVNLLKQDRAAVESAKTALGPAKFRRLKNLTKDFAAGIIEPERYIDCAVELFDAGISDPAFRSFVTGVIQACPSQQKSARLSRYLESLRVASRMQESAGTESFAPPAGGQQRHNEIPVAVAVPMIAAVEGETSPSPTAPPLPAEVPYDAHCCVRFG